MLQVHTRLGDFEILALLGRGGMGEVYEARQFNPDRRVAVKVLAPWLADDDEALERFWREAAVPANLDHPGIVRIISTGKTAEGIAYYAMHLVRGISLSEMIRRGNTSPQSDAITKSLDGLNTPSMAPPSTDEVPPPSPAPAQAMESSPQFLRDYRSERFMTMARIGALAARALAYAHQQGHIHRDIKPSNLMVDHHDQVYLVDFGLTRGLGPAGSGTSPGVVVGTPWYMSPEQAEGKTLDNRSDIYSLGVTLYELATQGLGPFTASRDDKKSVLAQVRAGTVLPLRTLAPGIPLELERIILRAMHLKPSKRYATAADLAHDLEAFLGHSYKPSGRPQPTSLPPERLRRSWPLWAGGIVAALVAVIGLVAGVVNYVNQNNNHRREQPGGESGAAKFDGTNALPEDLRKQRLDVMLGLMKANNEPLWKESVFGTNGGYTPLWNRLSLLAPDKNKFFLALTDPDRNCFDFSIDLAKTHSADGVAEDNRLGIFFGWRRRPADSDEQPRFFMVELDEYPERKPGHGRLMIGTSSVILPGKDRASGMDAFKLLLGEKAMVPLKKSGVYHTIQLSVRRDRAAVAVDGGNPQEFSIQSIRESDRLAANNLDVRGAVGIWVMRGGGSFRNATITLIKDE